MFNYFCVYVCVCVCVCSRPWHRYSDPAAEKENRKKKRDHDGPGSGQRRYSEGEKKASALVYLLCKVIIQSFFLKLFLRMCATRLRHPCGGAK